MITIFVGIIFIIFGFLYFYMPNVVIKLCEVIKKYLFNEKIIILNSQKIGIIFFLLGLTIIGLQINRHYISCNKYYLATKEFYNHNFRNSEKLCIEILSSQPKNVYALQLLGKTYLATGRPELAKNIFLKIKTLFPEKNFVVEKYLIQISSPSLRSR